MIVTTVSAQPRPVTVADVGKTAADAAPQKPDAPESKWDLVAADQVINMNEPAVYIIRLEDASLAAYRGGVQGLAATNPSVRGETKLDTESADSVAYTSYLADKQAQFITAMEQTVARSVTVKFQYKNIYNGMAVELTPLEAERVANLPGVVHIERDTMQHPASDVSSAWIGAKGIWNGTSTGGLPGTMGEGVIVGIIDSGINIDHPSFAATGDDGYTHVNPFGAGVYVGLCDTEPATYTCNSKLIGAWDFTEDDPLDDDDADHGSHTASTAAGNVVYSPTVYAPTTAITFNQISGIAPHANIIAYDTCTEDGCPTSATTAAADQAVEDGVDVINYSIGGGAGNPWTGTGAQSWLDVRDAGVFVATSAGNSGPDAETMGSPGNSPWMTTVGASSHNRKLGNMLTVYSDTLPIEILGEGTTGGYGPATIIYAGDVMPTNPGCDLPFTPTVTFNGEIVICEHDDDGPNYVSRVNKSEMLAEAGAGGFIMVTEADWGTALAVDSYAVPGMGVPNVDGENLKAWVAAGTVQTGTIRGTQIEATRGDVMAAFSSRGPNPDGTLAASIIKPDVTAPGRRILAAIAVTDPAPGDPPEFDVFQGTSMSSPNVAGAGALLRALHPDWTAAEIQSALMMSANSTNTLEEDAVTPSGPFDQGAGRIQVGLAAQAGLVLDETTGNFEDADPAEGGDPATLNLASLGNSECLNTCTWERTFESVVPVAVTYTATVNYEAAGLTVTVDPPTFTVPAFGTQVVTVTADVSALPIDEWQFGEVGFETDALHPNILWSEDFEGTFPPTGWTVVTNTGAGWNTNVYWGYDNLTFGSGQCADANSDAFGAEMDTELWSPPINLTAATAPYLFYQSNFQDYSGSGDAWLDISTDGGTNWTNLTYWTADHGPTSEMVDLAAYVGQTIHLRWRYYGDYAWYWQIDDVMVLDGTGATLPVSDLHMPLAVRPTTVQLPELVEINTRRNAGSYLVEDLQALEITDLTLDYYGFAQADMHEFQLYEDPTNDIPTGFFDDLDQVYYVTMTVAATDQRLVVEILETTSPDLDMAVGRDVDGDGPEVGEIVCQSATGGAYEACDVSGADLVAGNWWIIVLNWSESANAPDDVLMAVAVVGADVGNMTVTGPTSVPVQTDFDLRLFWDTPTMEAGDIWYGAVAIGTDPLNHGNIGTVPVNIVRHADDVDKDVDTAYPCEPMLFTLSVMPDISGEDLTYYLTDTLPAELEYVPGSAYAPSGMVDETVHVLTWSGQVITERES
jgi:subtilisin family serine protease